MLETESRWKMERKIYLWIEDRKNKASYMFWETLMKQMNPNVIVESKNNNSELIKAVKTLVDNENQYIIVFDNAFDNVQVCMEHKKLKKIVEMKKNVILLDLICFEYILLEFDKLIEWIYAIEDEFIEKRAVAILARQKLIETLKSNDVNYKIIQEVIEYDNNLESHNIEKLSSKLLFDLTRNTGFEVSKGRIGDCWIKSCCEWNERQYDDICGLDNKRLLVLDKMKSIYYGTTLYSEFSKIGLEVFL